MMQILLRFLFLPTVLCIGYLHLSAQNQYSNFKTMSQNIDALSREYPSICTIKSLVKTAGGKDIWVLTIGTGNKDSKPGIAVFGGVEENHLLGKELALGFAVSLLEESSSSELKGLLDKITFYVFPDVSPDATEQFFSDLKYERTVNARSTDDDRDFVFDEDPYEDLNKDGYITLIRVKDPSGKFTESDEDKRVMVMADLSKGQSGSYLIYSEGIDNDKDDSFNEDGAGGVNFNRNFTFNYEEFGLNAGMYPMSEPETKAVADFLFDRFNIYAVFIFGPQDNLGQPMKASERQGAATPSGIGQGTGQGMRQGMGRGQGMERGDRKITSIMRTDETINKLVSDKYHEITGAKGAPVTKTTLGNFMEWAYFHYGRYSFSTPAWWFPIEKGKSTEVAFLKFAEKNKINDVFVPWTEIKHPDFPGKKTEVGGIKPFALINPPADTLSDLITKNYKFITAIAAMHPELEFLDIKTENAGENIFRISLKLHNKGIFSTCAEIGKNNMWTRIMRISLEPVVGQSFLSGQKVQRIDPLEGDQSAEFNWLINGKGSVKVTAGALNVGIINTTIELK
ncbi:MAG: M14 family metallopeptidase [Bacteroidales bacterium]|nr:M14 family metallopeptidase [Bacteroidales bacterium]